MKIAIVAGPYLPIPPLGYGGTEWVIKHLITGLMEAGHEPILLAPADSKVDCELIPTADHSIFFAKTVKRLPAHLKRVAQIEAETKQKLVKLLPRIDIIHSHSFSLKDFEDFPNLTTLHGHIGFSEVKDYLEHKKLYYASISKNQQDACPGLRYVGVVHNGLDPADFPIVKQPADYVCFLGRFDREKNPHLAIELAISLGIKIKLAGKIDYQAEGYFDEELKKYMNHPLVEYLGEIGFKQKVELLSNAAANLHPIGFREPFGLTVIEAAYCGTPTLAIARGAMPELIEDGRTGVLVEDFIEGFHKIEQCFNMDRQYIAMRARSLFNYKTMTKQYIQAYKRVLRAFKAKSTAGLLSTNTTQLRPPLVLKKPSGLSEVAKTSQ